MKKFEEPTVKCIQMDDTDMIVTSGCEAGETPDQCTGVGLE